MPKKETATTLDTLLAGSGKKETTPLNYGNGLTLQARTSLTLAEQLVLAKNIVENIMAQDDMEISNSDIYVNFILNSIITSYITDIKDVLGLSDTMETEKLYHLLDTLRVPQRISALSPRMAQAIVNIRRTVAQRLDLNTRLAIAKRENEKVNDLTNKIDVLLGAMTDFCRALADRLE